MADLVVPQTPTEWHIHWRLIEEHIVPGKRLGRHVRNDSRSAAYLYQRKVDRALAAVLHARETPILDQGDVGSCTGNALTGSLGTDPVMASLPMTHKALDEALALAVYSAAETLDGDGPYPPQDNGSSGTSAARAAKNMGLIAGFTHATSVADMEAALQDGPVNIGINWYDSFDSPDANGLIKISPNAGIRGGHELELRGVDPAAKLFRGDNSWGTSWGDHGSYSLGFDDMDRLLGEDGDCTVLVDLSQPAPAPTPIPPIPTPTPPGPDADPADVALAEAQWDWAHERHVASNHKAAEAALKWLVAKGFLVAPS